MKQDAKPIPAPRRRNTSAGGVPISAQSGLAGARSAGSSPNQAAQNQSAAPTARAASVGAVAYQQYQAALGLLQQNRFEKALAAFEKLQEIAPPELAERCRIYIVACRRQLERNQLSFATPEERCDYAVSLLNTGFYEEARDHFEAILATHPQADYAAYALAVLYSITGQSIECLEYLAQAIRLNPRNRVQARSDTDFQGMTDDPRFTELIYPE